MYVFTDNHEIVLYSYPMSFRESCNESLFRNFAVVFCVCCSVFSSAVSTTTVISVVFGNGEHREDTASFR